MANGDSDRDTSQSKRPPLGQHDSDSQYSDHSHGHGHHVREHRTRATKHVVGGGASRLHARVPSSKTLHKTHGSTSSAKLTRRHTSPSPDRNVAPSVTAGHGQGHRRSISDISVSREPTGTQLKKNASHTSLKRNRSKVEVGKKSKSTTSLKSAGSNGHHHAPVNKHIKAVNQVHFNLGDEDEDEDEGEWVDASTSASPLLSRRTSVVSGGPSSAANSRPPTSQEQRQPDEESDDRPPNGGAQSPDRQSIISHKQQLTSRILERTASQQAPPMMSTEHVTGRTISTSRHHSPDSNGGSTLNGTPQLQSLMRPGSSGGKFELTSRFDHDAGSSGREGVTSRFVNQNSGPGSGPGGILASLANSGAISRAANGRAASSFHSEAPRQSKSTTHLEQAQRTALQAQHRSENPSDEEEAGTVSGIVGVTRNRSKRNTPYSAAQLEMNRTQQKLDLQRASSTLEQTVPHPGIAMGLGGFPVAATGSAYGSRDAALPKVLERLGTEYLVVRRYQHPIGRSLRRLQQLPGADKHRRIPKAGTHSRVASRAGSEYGGPGLRSGPVMNLQRREQGEGSSGTNSPTSSRDGMSHREPGVVGLIGGRIDRDRRPGSRRGYPGLGLNGQGMPGDETPITGSTTVVDSRMSTRLSGSSLVDITEDTSILATLRNLWDKNMDLSASQE
ncbi:hypothetical protein DL546_009617 [Coniochaeta pulveracea]|uniref:Uncharacterized protein n=1 Tax=Coniochaeta pulveracea TaxID=177199 RepID=A0A420YN65_9PEZI|nr:hypothetical protein DL546_009617 [Coniochaeta pulveracea]